jgi:hypothetical protein
MVKRVFVISFLLLLLVLNLQAQLGGESTYSFLNLTITPRSAALGSKVVALDEADQGVALTNPAHLSSQLHNQLSLSYVSYFADIKYAFVNYSRHVEGVGTFGIGMQHVGYGDFTEANVAGLITGSFSGYDMALHLSYARSIDSLFTFGVTLKPIYSHLEQYTSFGFAADIGLAYHSRDSLFSAGVVARNIGSMLKPYTPDSWEALPFELIFGFSQKLRHAPFRLVATFQQVQTSSLYFRRQSSTVSLFGDEEPQDPTLLDKLGSEVLSHLILGVEFVPITNFYVRGGYNFQRRNELKLEERVSTVGFSWGVGIKIKRFYINYSRATYHLVGGSNHFSLSTNLDDFFVKKNL